MSTLAKVLVALAALASVGFGIWHFTVPDVWDWFSYMDPSATELAVAVRAINVFFSLSLVLFGLIDLLLCLGDRSNAYSLTVVLGATCVLWLARVGLQILSPQGSMNPLLQYGKLSAFIAVLACNGFGLWSVLARGAA